MKQEIELKLSLSPQDARRLWRCRALRSLPRSPLRISTLTTSYFDTPDAVLRRNQFSLRLRRDGRSWLQTLKGPGLVHAGLHQRDEWEAPVSGSRLDFDALADTPARDLLAKSKVWSALAPRVTTWFRRSHCEVELAPGCTVELCLDRGEAFAGQRHRPISEIELELRTGNPARLFSFALELLQELPVRLEMASKAERGLALLNDGEQLPVRAQMLHLKSSMSPSDAMRATVWACLGQFSANESGLLASRDPEYLHQARVALRRLWAALSIFAAEFSVTDRDPEILEELRWLTKSLGPARDWDVFIIETLRSAAPHVTQKSALKNLKSRAYRRRGAARKEAVLAVSSTRYTALMLKFAHALLDHEPEQSSTGSLSPTPSLDLLATGLIEKRYQKALQRGAQTGRHDIEALHRLRISVKKLRYVVEFFRDLYPKKKTRPFVASLSQLQEDLGTLNDAAAAGRMCALLRRQDDPADLSEALTQIGDWWSAAAREKLAHLPGAWQEFAAIKRFWFGD